MIESLVVRSAEPFGDRYEWVSAVAHYAVDPDAPGSDRIADLGLAPRGRDGNVRFSGDLVLIWPADGGNRRAIVSVPNRGMVRLPYSGSGALPTGVRNPPSPGDGFLLRRGWTIALPGWQWDVPREAGFAGLEAPVADVEPGWLRVDFRVDVPAPVDRPPAPASADRRHPRAGHLGRGVRLGEPGDDRGLRDAAAHRPDGGPGGGPTRPLRPAHPVRLPLGAHRLRVL